MRLRKPANIYLRIALLLTVILTASCTSGGTARVFYIAGIPDQDLSVLETRFNGIAEYLSEETGLDVQYIPTIDYAAVVTNFRLGDIQMAWYGGLTGVQARVAVPDARAIAQRPIDAEFRSVFIADPGLGLQSLSDLADRSFTFGSESSTSGHLMPRHFMVEAEIDPESDLAEGSPSYSGSHDSTWQLVEAGSFQAGALNEAVWDSRVAAGDVDTSRVTEFYRTPPYYDYHWAIRGDVDEVYGEGTAESIQTALLSMDLNGSEQERQILESFQTDGFIETSNENYQAIEAVATELGILNP